jgi:hypothetical protein
MHTPTLYLGSYGSETWPQFFVIFLSLSRQMWLYFNIDFGHFLLYPFQCIIHNFTIWCYLTYVVEKALLNIPEIDYSSLPLVCCDSQPRCTEGFAVKWSGKRHSASSITLWWGHPTNPTLPWDALHWMFTSQLPPVHQVEWLKRWHHSIPWITSQLW